MPIYELYSQRMKRERGELPDVFQYHEIPNVLRVQIVHLWDDALGAPGAPEGIETYIEIVDILHRAYGVFKLIAGATGAREELIGHFLICDTEAALNSIELCARMMVFKQRRPSYKYNQGLKLRATEAIAELNARFLEHGVGYQFESGQLIRKDSELLHREVVQPTLRFLSGKDYRGPNEEFLSAHEHYAHGRYKESLNDCLKAFESTLKVICKKQNWAYNETDTANTLIDVVLSHGLVPSFLQSELGALRSLLASGIPTVRNKLGGHGQGEQPKEVPQHVVSYMLHMTATTILFLVESERNIP